MALIWEVLRSPLPLPMSPESQQEDVGVILRATASLTSRNLFELRLGALSKTPPGDHLQKLALAWSVQSWQR